MMGDLRPPSRILMGPGPSNVHYRVYQAMFAPVIGYFDPQLLAVMDEISEIWRLLLSILLNPEILPLSV